MQSFLEINRLSQLKLAVALPKCFMSHAFIGLIFYWCAFLVDACSEFLSIQKQWMNCFCWLLMCSISNTIRKHGYWQKTFDILFSKNILLFGKHGIIGPDVVYDGWWHLCTISLSIRNLTVFRFDSWPLTLGCLDKCDPILMMLTTMSIMRFSVGSELSYSPMPVAWISNSWNIQFWKNMTKSCYGLVSWDIVLMCLLWSSWN